MLGLKYGNKDIQAFIEGGWTPSQPSIRRKRNIKGKVGLTIPFNRGGSVRGRKAVYK